LTFTAGLELTDPLALAAELVLLLSVVLADEFVWVPDEPEEEVAADEDTEAADEDTEADPVPSEELLPEPPTAFPPVPLPEPPLSNMNVHSFTSCTSGCPSGVMGVNVILHASMVGPSGLQQSY
jgi:hypothetical protein